MERAPGHFMEKIMTDDTKANIMELLEEEIAERIEAARLQDNASAAYHAGDRNQGDSWAAAARAAEHRAQCYRLNRLKLEHSSTPTRH